MIGLVGGMGPYSGAHLIQCILDQTLAEKDQDHIPLVLLSYPDKISDRSDFLMAKTKVNPGHAISDMILTLEKLGASVVGIACNTAYAAPIYKTIQKNLLKNNCKVELVNMVQETVQFIITNYPNLKRVGLLTTYGTYKTNLYSEELRNNGCEVIDLGRDIQVNLIHQIIYDPINGIKTKSNPITNFAKKRLNQVIDIYVKNGAELIVVGCTEFSLAFVNKIIPNIPIVDSSKIMARALIKKAEASKLKDYRL